MEKIIAKIKELKKLSATEVDWTVTSEKMANQWQLFEELDEMADAKGTILGKYVRFQVGDGYAYYIVDKLNPTSAHISWLSYCDNYSERQFGERGGTLRMEEAIRRTTRMKLRR